MQIKNIREVVEECKESFGCDCCDCIQECTSVICKFKSAPRSLSESEIQQLEKGETC